MTDTAVNPFLVDNLAPVSEEVTAFDLEVTGTLPTELTGRYLRNGPNPIEIADPSTHHWFTGEGMVHGVRLDEGRASWYRNRWVRSPKTAALLDEPAPPSDWPEDHGVFSANTNVVGHAGRVFAVVEAGGPPIELDEELHTLRASNLDGTLPFAFSAHPKVDWVTGEQHVMAYTPFWGNQIQYLVVDGSGKVRRTVDIELPGSPMVHDLAITESYALVLDLPCVFSAEALEQGSRIPYRWDPDYEARIGLLPREGAADDITWCSIDPCYIFHPMNAYDDGDTVVFDAVRHPSMFSTQFNGPSEGRASLDRWVLNTTTGAASHQVLDDRPHEFPRIDERRMGLPYRIGYTSGVGPHFGQDALMKIDHTTGIVERREDADRFGYGEPAFVPRHEAAAEDDGWVLSLRHDTETDLSDLVVFDSQGLTEDPVAVVHLPARVPTGFHGNWFPDSGAS